MYFSVSNSIIISQRAQSLRCHVFPTIKYNFFNTEKIKMNDCRWKWQPINWKRRGWQQFQWWKSDKWRFKWIFCWRVRSAQYRHRHIFFLQFPEPIIPLFLIMIKWALSGSLLLIVHYDAFYWLIFRFLVKIEILNLNKTRMRTSIIYLSHNYMIYHQEATIGPAIFLFHSK